MAKAKSAGVIVKVSAGQAIVEEMEAYVRRFVVLPPSKGRQSLVMVLWAIHTWMYERFPASPRLVFTADTKEAGKTLCMEVLGALCRGPKLWATLRPLMLLRWAKQAEGKVTAMIDEAEKLSSGAIGDVRSIFSSGANRGGSHGITNGAEGYVEFSTFWPAAFALIGDVMDVVRSRSIGIHCERSDTPVEDFRGNREDCEAEGRELAEKLREFFGVGESGSVNFTRVGFQYVPPSHLSGREREFWGPLFSIAVMMDLDAGMLADLVAVSTDLINLKQLPPRKLFNAEAEAGAERAREAERALRDLAAVLSEDDCGDIFSVEAVDALKAIPSGPWRTYRGVGLTQDSLGGLLRSVGLPSRLVQRGKGAKRVRLNGWRRADVLAKAAGGGK